MINGRQRNGSSVPIPKRPKVFFYRRSGYIGAKVGKMNGKRRAPEAGRKAIIVNRLGYIYIIGFYKGI